MLFLFFLFATKAAPAASNGNGAEMPTCLPVPRGHITQYQPERHSSSLTKRAASDPLDTYFFNDEGWLFLADNTELSLKRVMITAGGQIDIDFNMFRINTGRGNKSKTWYWLGKNEDCQLPGMSILEADSVDVFEHHK